MSNRLLTGVRVLVVDDEPLVRNVFRRWLTGQGASILEASSVVSACEMLADRNVRVDVALVDFMMPGLSGAHLIAWLRLNRPATPIILVSAFPEPGLRPPPDLVLTKPLTRDALRDAIAGVVAESRHVTRASKVERTG